MPKEQQPKPLTKSEMVLDVAMEAKYSLSPGTTIALVQVPNHLTMDKPSPLIANYDFASWLMWRCYKKHGVIVYSAVINNVIKLLNGMTQCEETIPAQTGQQEALASEPAPSKALESTPVFPPIRITMQSQSHKQTVRQSDHPAVPIKNVPIKAAA